MQKAGIEVLKDPLMEDPFHCKGLNPRSHLPGWSEVFAQSPEPESSAHPPEKKQEGEQDEEDVECFDHYLIF